MNRATTILAASVLALLGVRPAVAEVEPCVPSADRTIAVTGTATLHLPPNRVMFSVGVESEAENVAQAFEINNAKVQALLEALKRKGVKPESMQTSSVHITPRRDPKGQEQPGVRVFNTVTIATEETKRTGELLQTAITTGANRIAGLRFFAVGTDEQRQRGLELAFADAQSKAEVLAALAEQPLGGAICIAERPVTGPPQPMFEAAAMRSASVPIETGTEAIVYALDVVFELMPE
ncbi:MAG TPA: SIMPL domain-containing protein [Burkholderiaceae bacterium]|nr:SIMPL domain-containing protein [Burkholderiaceae bacterium]